MTTRALTRALVAATCVALVTVGSPVVAEKGGPVPAVVPAYNASGAEMTADLIFVRPISLVGSIVGAALFVVTLPFTLPTQSTDDASRELVGKPLEYTFNRPLGDFNHCGAARHPCGDF